MKEKLEQIKSNGLEKIEVQKIWQNSKLSRKI